MYEYDQGNGWRVEITCVEEYRAVDRWNIPPEKVKYPELPRGLVVVPMDPKDIAEDQRVFDAVGNQGTEQMREAVADCIVYMKPVCLSADGLPVMDDVGGLPGYCQFLEIIHGTNDKKKDKMKEWAMERGWNGRKQKPSSIL